MNKDSTFDHEFFQKLLESAFAVQESGMNAGPLARIVEIQRAIRAGHLDVDQTMQLIAQCARVVANASGVAVGRLNDGQLIYGAGSGCAASSVGRRVMATFSASAPSETRPEILRVENAETDARIEAAICRQFGANSLIILPIYHESDVAGVLQVLFDEAHAFSEQEVRMYRLLAGLVEEAMSQVTVVEQTESEQTESELSAELVVQPEGELMPAPSRDSLDQNSLALRLEQSGIRTSGVPSITTQSVMPAMENSWLSTFPAEHRVNHVPIYGGVLRSSLLVAAVLIFGSWILYRNRPSAMFSIVPSEAPKSSATDASPLQPTPQVSTNSTPNGDAAGNVALRSEPVRYSTPRVAKRASESGDRVRYFGDDVTVRYFNPKPATAHLALREGNVRRISEDVTVRYFQPRNAAPQDQAVGPDDRQSLSR